MLLFALLAAATAMAPSPVGQAPGEVRSHKDWVAGCDNLGACAAVALIRTPPGRDDYLTIRVERAAGPSSPRISLAQRRLSDWIETDDEAVQLWIEGGGDPIRVPHGGTLARSDVHELIERLQREKELRVTASPDRYLGPISLAGSSAMLRYIDEAQGRVGRSDALVAKGNNPPPPVVSVARPPGIEQPPVSGKPPFPVQEAVKLAAARRLFCAEADPRSLKTHRLDDRTSLVLIASPCDSGAYNHAVEAFTVRDGAASLSAADLALPGGAKREGGRTAWNLSWDARARRLFAEFLGRGLGDCGVRRAFAWDGTWFRLVEQSEMPECGGVRDFITTWRAEVL